MTTEEIKQGVEEVRRDLAAVADKMKGLLANNVDLSLEVATDKKTIEASAVETIEFTLKATINEEI